MQMSQESFSFFCFCVSLKSPIFCSFSHRVKFSTLTIFNKPYCSFQHQLDGLVGRRDLAVFV